MIIRPLFVTVLAYNGLSYQIALGPLCMNYTLWEDAVAMGVLCALRLPLEDSFSRFCQLSVIRLKLGAFTELVHHLLCAGDIPPNLKRLNT